MATNTKFACSAYNAMLAFKLVTASRLDPMSGSTLFSIPNIITAARIVLIPCFVISFYLPTKHNGIITAGLFCLAGVTDWLDGFLARQLNQVSRFGAFLDPVADKLIVAVALVLLVGNMAQFG